MRFVRTTYRIIRICLSKVLNKQFLIFLFFLGLSGAFWLFLALDEEYEIKMETRLQLQGMGQNVVITTEPPATLQFTLRDRGSTLLRYLYGRSLPPISIDFNQVANRSGHVRLPASELLRQLNSRLEPGTRIGSAQPDTVEFYFNYGLSKRVPVRLRQRFRAAKEYYVSSVDIEPDSVTVYAARPQLDTIYAAYVRPLRYRQFTDSAHLQLALRPEVGAKFVPDRVAVHINVDRLTEKTVQVPVRWVNFPATKTLRAFPSKVNVTFQIGASNYRRITADDFTLVVNYEDLIENATGRCPLELRSLPQGVSHVRLSPESIDFLIEDVPSE